MRCLLFAVGLLFLHSTNGQDGMGMEMGIGGLATGGLSTFGAGFPGAGEGVPLTIQQQEGCPPGYALSPDGRHCGIECFVCNHALDEESCNTTTVCAPWATACFTEVRRRDGITTISKGCQQDQACVRNMRHNVQIIENGGQQCNEDYVHSVCMNCCFETSCNEGLGPYVTNLQGCTSFEADFVTFVGLQDNDEVVPFGEALLSCPDGYVQGDDGINAVECSYDYQYRVYKWNANPLEFGTCIDVDECSVDNGGCGGGALCFNEPGSYVCVCPTDYDDYILIDGHICDRNECNDPNNGGCEYNCTNTVGSFLCSCPEDEGLYLAEDGLNCVVDQCFDSPCDESCVNTIDGPRCGCFNDGYEIDSTNGFSCIDFDECTTGLSGCEQRCENTDGGFNCFCDDGFELNADGKTCRINLCMVDNGGCEQQCTRVNDTAVRCSCSQGYRYNETANICEDINECFETMGLCEHTCTNLDGSYQCECPTGLMLRNDRKTCGTACYSCNGAKTNEECNANPLEVCIVDQESCENTVRIHNGVKMISKGCKQTTACLNSFRKFPDSIWDESACVPGSMNDVCTCCCKGHMCNYYERACMPQSICGLKQANVVLVYDVSNPTDFATFQRTKSFVKGIMQSYNLGDNAVKAAILTYSEVPENVRYFDQTNAPGSVILAIERINPAGTGTNTGNALNFVADLVLDSKNGWDNSLSTIVIVVTDGASKDVAATLEASTKLRAKGAMTFAIGVGNMDPNEVEGIAGSFDRAFTFDTYENMTEEALGLVSLAVCYDVDECLTGNGGCSDICTNTIGSYACSCEADRVLDIDQKTCVDNTDSRTGGIFNECGVNNGGCSQICVDLEEGYQCQCFPGFEDVGGYCYNVNECLQDVCQYSNLCVDTEGGYYCNCPLGEVRTSNKTHCVPATSTYDCPAGFEPLGHSCIMKSAPVTALDAESACGEMGARVMVVSDAGIRTLLRRKNMQAWIVSEMPEEENETCTYIGHYKDVISSNCLLTLPAFCEIVRETGLMIFSHEWPSGAQGVLMMPTGVNEVTVTFPHTVQHVNTWNCKVQSPESGLNWIISQDDHERQSGDCGFVINNMAVRFPDYEVVVTANSPIIDATMEE